MGDLSHEKLAFASINISLANLGEEKPGKPEDLWEWRVDYRAPAFTGNLAITCDGVAASDEEKALEKKLAELTNLRQTQILKNNLKQ